MFSSRKRTLLKMMRIPILIQTIVRLACLGCLLALFGSNLVLAQEPELIVEVDQTTLYNGDSVTYVITLNNVDEPVPPKLADLPDFLVESLGSQDQNFRSIMNLNGVRTEIVRKGRKYLYKLTPKSTGQFTIGAPRVTIGGKELEGRVVELAVRTQDHVRLLMSVDRPSVFPSQEFTISLQVLVKSLPDPYADRDPVAILQNPPLLNIAWLDDDSLPKSLKSDQPLRDLLQRYLSNRGTGFGVNGYRDNSPFALLDSRPAMFHPRPKVKMIADADGNESEFWEYEFKRTLRAGGPGVIEFVPATIKGAFGTSVARGRLQGEELFAKSQPVVVEVRDVPTVGQPESYIGAVGKFSIVAELSPTNAHVGDPLTLSITLNGSGQLADAQPPKLDKVEAITGSFKVYEGTTATTDQSKKFTYSLRPLSSSVKQLPEIEVAFFDVDSEKFVSLKTPPIPVTISEAERLSSSSVVSSGPAASSDTNSGLQVAEGGLFGNHDQLSSLKDDRPKLSFFAGLWAAMVLTAISAHTCIALVRQRNSDPRRQRIKTSLTRARSLLESAKLDANGQICGGELDRARQALVGLVADYADLPMQGISTRDVDDHLAKLGTNDDLRAQLRILLDQCDAARFGSTNQSVSASEVQTLLTRLNQTLSQAKKLVLVFGLLFLTGCSSPVNNDLAKQFVEAGRMFEAAQSSEDFLNIAARYQQIAEAGLASGAVFYNQGNAWLKAGQPGRAIASYRQALRFQPGDEHTLANLKAALSKAGLESNAVENQPAGALSYIYFWRNWFNLKQKLVILSTLLGLALLYSLAIWRSANHRWTTVCLLALTIVFAIATWFDYRDQYVIRHGVTIRSATAYKGTGADYGPAFTRDLSEGTEFIVTDQQLDWLQIELKDLGRGWIRSEQATVY